MALDTHVPSVTLDAVTRERRRAPLVVVLAALVLLSIVVLAVFGAWLAPRDPNAQSLLATVRTPGGGFVLGTDDLGRDVLSRLIAGTRSAVVGPLVVALGCAVLGSALGLIAGYIGGFTDTVVSRLLDVMFTLPALLVAIVLVGVAGGGYWLTAGVLILLSFPLQTRLVRSATLAQSRLTYLDAARTLGLSRRRIMFGHLLPNVTPILLTTFLLDFTGAMVAYSGLAYLGLGVAPGRPDWGGMIGEGQAYITTNPWICMAPTLAVVATATSATLVGDWLYDRLSAKVGGA